MAGYDRTFPKELSHIEGDSINIIFNNIQNQQSIIVNIRETASVFSRDAWLILFSGISTSMSFLLSKYEYFEHTLMASTTDK